jgi:response regulator NasT
MIKGWQASTPTSPTHATITDAGPASLCGYEVLMGRHCRVLIAEDDKDLMKGLRAQLEALEYEVVAQVDDGQKAVEACARHLPDLAILDIEMPTLDGLSAARIINQDHDIPVVILSAHSQPHLVEQAVADRVILYLVKPVNGPSLHAAIQTALAQSDENRALRDNVAALEGHLRERKLIERAKGILQTRRGLTEPEAFRYLQRQSQDRRIPMAKLAEMIVQADELLEGPMSPSPSGAPLARAFEHRTPRGGSNPGTGPAPE